MLSRRLVALLASGLCHASPVSFSEFLARDSDSGRTPDIPRLKPTVRWDRQLDDWNDLIPQIAQQLYFGSPDPLEKHQFADLTANFSGRAVVLEHSVFVKDVRCSTNAIDIVFTEKSAFAMVKEEWQAVTDFMLVTNSDTCGALFDQLSFWDVSTLTFKQKSLTVRAAVTMEHDIGGVLSQATLTWGTWQPGPPVKSPHSSAGHTRLARRSAKERLKKIGRGLKKAGQALGGAAMTAIEHTPGYQVGKYAINKGLELWNPELKTTVPVDIKPEDGWLDTTGRPPAKWARPWKLFDVKKGQRIDNVEMNANLGLYCVDCHIKGQVHVEGRAQFSTDGVKSLYAACDADFTGQFTLGLVADGSVAYRNEAKLFSSHIPKIGFSVQNLLIVGAFIDARVRYQAELNANGNIMAGVKMTSCKFKTRIDYVNPERSEKPTFEPKFENIFDASAEVTLTAGLSVPLSIGLGVVIEPLKKIGKGGDYTVTLTEQPGVNARAKYSTSTPSPPTDGGDSDGGDGDGGDGDGEEGGGGDEGDGGNGEEGGERGEGGTERRDLVVVRDGTANTCNGIDWDLKFHNLVFINLIGGWRQIRLHEFESKIAGGCIPSKNNASHKRAQIGAERTTKPLRAREELWNDADFDFVNSWEKEFDASEMAALEKLADEATDAIDEADVEFDGYAEGTDFIMIQDYTNTYQIIQDEKGFLGVGAATAQPVPGSLWAEWDGIVMTDYLERQMKFNSKNLRTHGWSDITLGEPHVDVPESEAMALVPAKTKNAARPYVYVGETLDSKAYTLLTCFYTTGGNRRLFLVSRPKTATRSLQLAQSRLTGGKIKDCYAQTWMVKPEDVEIWA